MKNRNDIDALKHLFVEHSEPNEKNIKNKIEFNIDSNQKTLFTDILVRTRVRNILILLITIVLLSAISLSVVFSMDLKSNVIEESPIVKPSLQFFNESKILWKDDFVMEDYNDATGTTLMKFRNYMEVISERASNMNGYFRMFYENIKYESLINITMHIHLENKLSDKFETYTHFQETMLWNGNTVKYNKSLIVETGERIYNLYFNESSSNCNYIIDISYISLSETADKSLEDFLNDLQVA